MTTTLNEKPWHFPAYDGHLLQQPLTTYHFLSFPLLCYLFSASMRAVLCAFLIVLVQLLTCVLCLRVHGSVWKKACLQTVSLLKPLMRQGGLGSLGAFVLARLRVVGSLCACMRSSSVCTVVHRYLAARLHHDFNHDFP